MLRAVNTLACLVMLGFAAVQVNDPDGALWAVYYVVPAFWALVAGHRQRWLHSTAFAGALWASVAAWAGLVWYYWPRMPDFWLKQVWMQEETAREGMGLMVALAVLLIAAATAYRKR